MGSKSRLLLIACMAALLLLTAITGIAALAAFSRIHTEETALRARSMEHSRRLEQVRSQMAAATQRSQARVNRFGIIAVALALILAVYFFISYSLLSKFNANDVVAAAIRTLRPYVVGRPVDSVTGDLGGFYRLLTHDSQLRWLGPEKGVMHMAAGAVVNAAWDLAARQAGPGPRI